MKMCEFVNEVTNFVWDGFSSINEGFWPSHFLKRCTTLKTFFFFKALHVKSFKGFSFFIWLSVYFNPEDWTFCVSTLGCCCDAFQSWKVFRCFRNFLAHWKLIWSHVSWPQFCLLQRLKDCIPSSCYSLWFSFSWAFSESIKVMICIWGGSVCEQQLSETLLSTMTYKCQMNRRTSPHFKCFFVFLSVIFTFMLF